MNLPDYNPEARCPKCGFDSVTTKYVPRREIPDDIEQWRSRFHGDISYVDESGNIVTKRPEEFSPVIIPEHLLRTCVRCNYQWNEEVIGVKEINVKSEVA